MKHFTLFSLLMCVSLAVPQISRADDVSDESFPKADQCYLLRPSQALSSCISEQSDNSLYVGAYDIATRCYWEFIPTENDSCFYIRNMTTGNYIQSTKTLNSSIVTGTEPVEIYVGKNTVSTSSVYGYWYMSSTDNSTYNQVSANTYGLNRGGSAVVSYYCGSGNVNSFWSIEETDYLYEAQPFNPSSAFGQADYKYSILSADGQFLSASAESGLSLASGDGAGSQSWYFVGTQNSAGGYLIVSADNNLAIGANNALVSDTAEAVHWCVYEVDDDAASICYLFRPYGDASSNALTVDGDSLFSFSLIHERSDYMKSLRVYNMPCGTTSSAYLKQLEMEGDAVVKPIVYPLGTVGSNGKTIIYTVSKPTSVYDLYTKDRGLVARGEDFTLSTTLTPTQPDGFEVFAYFDWNGDGIFETSYTLTYANSTYSATISVPADAADGATRMRIRITDNELEGAEDDTNGQVMDFVIYATEAPEAYTVEASSSDLTRGTVSVDPESDSYAPGTTVTVTATRLGNGLFQYWMEGRNVVSTSSSYEFTVERPVSLVAYFRPNTRGTATGIDEAVTTDDAAPTIDIALENKVVVVTTNEAVKSVQVYDVKGARVAQSTKPRVDLENLPTGTYVVNVATAQSNATAKIYIR